MDAPRAGGRVAHAGGHVVGLIAQPDFGADAVAITPSAGQFQDQPAIGFWTDILPKLYRLAERADDHVNSSAEWWPK